MKAQFTDRPIHFVDVPVADGFEVLRPEDVAVRFANGKTVDVGALCYLRRSNKSRGPNKALGRQVDRSSKDATRVLAVRRLVAQMSEELREGGGRVESVRDRYSRFIPFMAWADSSAWGAVLEGQADVRECFREYVQFLRERVNRNEISGNTGAQQQNAVLQVLQSFTGNDDLARGVNVLRVNVASASPTSPPSEELQGKVLAMCECLFEGFSEVVLGALPYPAAVKVPGFVNLPEDMLWLFPSTPWFFTPSMARQVDRRKEAPSVINYSEGRLATVDELLDQGAYRYEGANWGAAMMRKRAEAWLDVANGDPQHGRRRALANQAMNMFLVLFISQSAMNWAQVVDLSWNEEFEVEVSRQSFRTVKWRAGRKVCHFELPIAFMSTFRRYLEVRRYLLRDAECAYLFFKFGQNAVHAPGPMRSQGLNGIYGTLRRIDDELPSVGSREWRAAKSHWLIEKTDIATAARILQNSEATVARSYAAGSETAAIAEMGAFLTQVSSAVVDPGVKLDGGIECANGNCTGYGAPQPRRLDSPKKPDCGNPEGCLFCDKFKVHADEHDTRKLLSCRHCIRIVSSTEGDERVQMVFRPVVERIDELLTEISGRDGDMVRRVEHEVDEEGELTPYWAQKMEVLIELGLVA